MTLRQKVRPALKDWSIEQMIEFLLNTGFSHLSNIFKFNRLDGSRLL